MLNWFAWSRTVLTFKQRAYAKLKCLKWNCFSMLNWIVRNWTVFYIETVLTLSRIIWNKTVCGIKIDLTLHTQQWLVYFIKIHSFLLPFNWIKFIVDLLVVFTLKKKVTSLSFFLSWSLFIFIFISIFVGGSDLKLSTRCDIIIT